MRQTFAHQPCIPLSSHKATPDASSVPGRSLSKRPSGTSTATAIRISVDTRGSRSPFSIRVIVVRGTPTAAASCSWVRPARSRSRLTFAPRILRTSLTTTPPSEHHATTRVPRSPGDSTLALALPTHSSAPGRSLTKRRLGAALARSPPGRARGRVVGLDRLVQTVARARKPRAPRLQLARERTPLRRGAWLTVQAAGGSLQAGEQACAQLVDFAARALARKPPRAVRRGLRQHRCSPGASGACEPSAPARRQPPNVEPILLGSLDRALAAQLREDRAQLTAASGRVGEAEVFAEYRQRHGTSPRAFGALERAEHEHHRQRFTRARIAISGLARARCPLCPLAPARHTAAVGAV